MINIPEKIQIKNYKCFKEFVGFNIIKTSNIIIGRNNIGKSSIVDMFEYFVSNTIPPGASVKITYKLSASDIRPFFRDDTSGGDIAGLNHWMAAGVHLVGKTITIKCSESNVAELEECEDNTVAQFMRTQDGNRLINSIKMPFNSLIIKRLLAERDILPEVPNYGSLDLNPNGSGATNIIQSIINKAELDSRIIQETIKDAFNQIMHPDLKISNIVSQYLSSGTWEIFIDDEMNGRVALSKCGSGLKTVLLVLLMLFAIPALEANESGSRIFIFEEIENNLHPALQRRLFSFIHDIATKKEWIVFFTTHSNVVIDLFSRFDNASLYNVRKESENIKIEEIKTIFEKRNTLDELDIRASDLLQTNALIWVEGPSDRVYINKMISLIGDGTIKEGIHYQYLYYGGRLLAHYSVGEDEIEGLLNIIKVNMNSIIVIDSDKKQRQTPLNDTKTRIRDSFSDMQLLCWVTKGREIENYIPQNALKRYFNNQSIDPLEQYQDISLYLNSIEDGTGKKYERNKVAFAEQIVRFFEKEDIICVYDVKENIESIIERTKSWNKLI